MSLLACREEGCPFWLDGFYGYVILRGGWIHWPTLLWAIGFWILDFGLRRRAARRPWGSGPCGLGKTIFFSLAALEKRIEEQGNALVVGWNMQESVSIAPLRSGICRVRCGVTGAGIVQAANWRGL